LLRVGPNISVTRRRSTLWRLRDDTLASIFNSRLTKSPSKPLLRLQRYCHCSQPARPTAPNQCWVVVMRAAALLPPLRFRVSSEIVAYVPNGPPTASKDRRWALDARLLTTDDRRSRRTAGFAHHHQLRRNHHAGRIGSVALQSVEQQLGGVKSLILPGPADRRQRHAQHVAEGEVTDTYDCDVFRDSQSGFPDRLQRSNRGGVVRAKRGNGTGRGITGEGAGSDCGRAGPDNGIVGAARSAP